ncbi:MAG: thymidylate kinase [Patescibacteria group bacterium]
MRGVFIVLEGTDGSGKGTQAKILYEKLKKKGFKVLKISFPQYGSKSAGPVEEYLNGKYGSPDKLNPYAASLFYALDRFDFSAKIREKIENGWIVLADRYVDSNAGHQGGKIKDEKERVKFIAWLYGIEYGILNIPKPDLAIILHVPAEIGQKLIKQRKKRDYVAGGKKHDGHEADFGHLKAAENSYLWLAKKYPDEHILIECLSQSRLLSPEEISRKVWQAVGPLLAKLKK